MDSNYNDDTIVSFYVGFRLLLCKATSANE